MSNARLCVVVVIIMDMRIFTSAGGFCFVSISMSFSPKEKKSYLFLYFKIFQRETENQSDANVEALYQTLRRLRPRWWTACVYVFRLPPAAPPV